VAFPCTLMFTLQDFKPRAGFPAQGRLSRCLKGAFARNESGSEAKSRIKKSKIEAQNPHPLAKDARRVGHPEVTSTNGVCMLSAREIPFDSAQGRLSLRLKSGSARDDASRLTIGKVLREIYVEGVDVLGAEVAEE
jgi:hypothetical protein